MLTRSSKLFIATLFACSSLLTGIQAQSIAVPLFKRDKVQESKINGLRSKYPMAVLEYNQEMYQHLKSSDYKTLTISFPAMDEPLSLRLEKSEIFADGFFVNTDKEKSVDYKPGLYYHGVIEGQPSSVVAITMFDNEVAGVINTGDGSKLVIGRSSSLRSNSFLVFDATKAEGPEINCLAEELPTYTKESQLVNVKKLESRVVGGCVNIYFELGNSVYTNKGGTQQATDYITGIFNVVAELYRRDGINVRMSQVQVWTTPEPYSASASSALTDFGRAKQNNINGNLAQLVRLKTSGGWSGIAWVNVLCSPYGSSQASGPYSYAEISATYNSNISTPTYSWSTEVITHELGHNLGSPHTHACSWTGGAIDGCATPEGSCSAGPTPTNGGTIMSYCHLTSIGINYANGFGPQPKALITNRINAAACAVACTGATCAAPTGLNTSNVATTSATLSWAAASGAVSYTVQYKTAASTTWITLASATTATSISLTGLVAGTAYQWQVRTNCATTNTAFTQASFTTSTVSTACASAPSGLSASAITSSSATVSWAAVSGAVNYTVQYKTTAATTWNTLANTTNTSASLTGLVASTAYSWQVRANCSSTSTAYTASAFNTTAASVCAAPTNLISSNVASTTATISWSAVSGVFNYTIEIKTAASTSWISLGTTTATAVNISGLTSATTYDWRIKTNCSSGSSAYSQAQFTTTGGATCNAPASVTASSIAITTATVSWPAVSGAVNYTVELKTSTASTWTVLSTTATTSANLSGLIAATTYNVRVKTNCSTITSVYTQSSFTTLTSTPVTCAAPASLLSTNLTSSGATVSWAAVSGAINYTLEYKANSSTTWLVAAAALTTTSFNLSGLVSNTLYDWRVKTNCSAASSGYTTSQFTTTAPANNTCPGTSDLVANETLATAATITMNTTVLGKISPAGDNDYFRFVVNAGGSLNILLSGLVADYDMRIYNASGSTIALSQNAGASNESANLTLAAGTYYVRIYGWNGSNNATSCYNLKITPGTATIYSESGTYYAGEFDTKVYPNPVSTWLNFEITGLSGSAKTAILDLQGRVHSTLVTKHTSNRLNVTHLQSGFYLLRVEDEDKRTKVVKFLKTE